MATSGKLHHVRSAILGLSTATLVLGIPSLPWRPYHLLFWAIALLVEIALLVAFWPLDRN
jgi:hypothetical protein